MGPIRIQRGILQGDSFCVNLFTLCINPIAWYLRATEGYTFSHDKTSKITHTLFVDDLKSYHKNAVKAATIASNLESMFEDIGLHWGISKCAAVHVKRGKIVPNEGLPLHSGNQIPVLGEGDYYKFLGKYENATQLEKEVQRDASKEYIRRLSVIWSSPLSFTRKVKATNSFATSVLLYHMWTADWPIEHLRELDRSTRQLMNDNKAKHKHESNSLLYLPVDKGGKGMQELETLYKTTKIKTAHYLTVSADPHVQLVSTFQNVKDKKSLRSIVKDARTFAGQLDLNIEYNRVESKTTIKTSNSTIEVNQPQPKHLKTILRKKVEKKLEEEVKQQRWIGQYTVQQWQDEHLHHESYNIAKVWPNIPNIVYSVHTSIVQQLITTKVYNAKKVQNGGEDLLCSFCRVKKETVPHIMCSCSAIAQTLYTARHDRMLRPVYYAILKTLGITNNEEDEEDETIPWYREIQPKCCVETKEVKVLWNIPLHLDVVPKDGANKPDIAICNKKERQWLIFEGTVCNIGQIQERDKLKTEKYADLRASLKRLYPGYNVIQVNLVFDFLAGYHKELIHKLNNVGLSDSMNVIRKCQKWVIAQNCEIVKAFHSRK